MKKRMLLQRYSTNLLAFMVFTLSARAAAPQTGTSQAEAPYMTMEALSRAVVYLQGERQRVTTIAGREYELGIRVAGESQFGPWTESVSGTGFIVAVKSQVFIVTADHVARELKMNAKVTLLGEDGKPNTVELKTLLGAASNSGWTAHDAADVAARSLEPNEPLKSEVLKRAIPIDFIEKSLSCPVAEYPLIVVGFPLGLGVREHFSPLSRDTNAASGLISLQRADNGQSGTFFLLQDPSIGGYSGAPVFTRTANLFGSTVLTGMTTDALVGLVHGTISDDTGGKLAAVVPSHYVWELMNKLTGGVRN